MIRDATGYSQIVCANVPLCLRDPIRCLPDYYLIARVPREKFRRLFLHRHIETQNPESDAEDRRAEEVFLIVGRESMERKKVGRMSPFSSR